MQTESPMWLLAPAIKLSLVKIVNQLNCIPAIERTNNIHINLSDKAFSSLKNPEEPGDDDLLWRQIEMAIDDGVFSITHSRKYLPNTIDLKARLTFNLAKEEIVRSWLGMPVPDIKSPWTIAVESYIGDELNKSFLLSSPAYVNHMQPHDLLESFGRMRSYLLSHGPTTVKQLSAFFLRGVSKSLDSKDDEWLASALNVDRSLILPRRIHLTAYSTSTISTEVLFIENLDTFEACCRCNYMSFRYILIYLSGYKASSSRIRSDESVRIFVSGSLTTEIASRCLSSEAGYSHYVWGDLDYTGLSIGISLRKAFPELNWLVPAYDLMMQGVIANSGHSINDKSKGEQKYPDESQLWGRGATYLSFIKTHEKFIDQEAVSIKDLSATIQAPF